MNKTAIKNFAVWARRKLISDITYKAGMIGITESGIAEPLPQSTGDMQFFDIGTKNYTEISGIEIKQRNALVSAIRSKERSSNYKTAFQNVIEEVAYTWFNRLIAVRFMEVNDYLPSRVRVLSSENPAKNEPDFVTNPFDTDLEFTPYEQDRVLQLKDENKLDELFRMLFIKQCNKFNEILPELFEKTDDYSELLLTISFTDKDGVVYHLIHDIAEDDFNISKEGQVEIIGWLYQFYNTEPKDKVFSNLKKNIKISKDNIPAATQLFTPDWIVRYMVENSLGRLWTNGHPSVDFKKNMLHYLEDAEQESSVKEQLEIIRRNSVGLNPKEIKVIDPCMGSGHILVYAFDVLVQIYESNGYTQRDAAQSILENNLYGLDIDDRAAQLAYFAVMMKARQYDRRIFARSIHPHIYSIIESNSLDRSTIEYFTNSDPKLSKEFSILVDELHDAKEYGSILNVSKVDFDCLYKRIEEIQEDINIFRDIALTTIPSFIRVAEIMANQYDVVITNPPYMGSSGMGVKLSEFTKKNYPTAKLDLFACFIVKCEKMLKKNGYYAMITQQAYMFLGSYEKLRSSILANNTIINMLHFGYGTFGADFGTTAFVISKNRIPNYEGKYIRLAEYRNVDEKEKVFNSILAQKNSDLVYTSKQERYYDIPGSNFVYWISEKFLNILKTAPKLEDIATIRVGMHTGNNEIFVREWYELNYSNIGFGCPSNEATLGRDEKWYPYNKGGGNRRWYGYRSKVVNWRHGGSDIHNFHSLPMDYHGAPVRAKELQFREGITWSDTGSTGIFASRYSPMGSMFDVKGSSAFMDHKYLYYVLGFQNVKIATHILNMFNPTITYQVGNISTLPLLFDETKAQRICDLVKENIAISKADYDSDETSWDFSSHPLIPVGKIQEKNMGKISWHYQQWSEECNTRFAKLKANEEELNKLFVEIYGLEDELNASVSDDEVSISKAELGKCIRTLISYAVGCMFGRYSLDTSGLAFAGDQWDSGKYQTFLPDADNCIPITDEDYFEDDVVGKFVQFIKLVYGPEYLEENLDYIANALGNKGNTSRDTIRNYFLNEFIKDHIKTYQKKPIYWLFDSGKQNGFKGLVYMHRWNADTVGNLRVEYLHRMQRVYEKEIERMQDTIDHTQGRDQTAAQKRKEKLVNQLKEAKDYDAKIAHIALARVDIDLDDGVKVNYDKVQKGQDGKNLEILAKI